MTHFTPIAYVDTYELAASLRERAGLFGAVYDGERLLSLRWQKAIGHPESDNFAYRAPFAKWPEAKTLLSRLKRLGDERLGEVAIGRVFLEILDPGARPLMWSCETSSYFERYTRLHLPIRTNPRALMHAGLDRIETTHLLPGQLTVVNVRVPHCAINLGEHPRVHLILDVRKKEAPDA